ncbi:MAG: 23S rRNA (pseudouridine(1915)-N(3))-methyltransferase RlmH [Rhodospirillales bacterium]
MRLVIACVGRLGGGPALGLYRDYAGRLAWPVTLKEVEERRKLPAAERLRREAELLSAAIPKGARIVALDERGKAIASAEFARLLGRWQGEGAGDVAFVIGGADGLDPAFKKRAHWLLSLGPMTWPHLLCRALLAEQLYRAQSILAGHPYHRE